MSVPKISKLYKTVLGAFTNSTISGKDISGKDLTLEASNTSSNDLLQQGVLHCLKGYEGEPTDQFCVFADVVEDDIFKDMKSNYVDVNLDGHYVDFVDANYQNFEGMWVSQDVNDDLRFDLGKIGWSKCILGYILSPDLDALEVGQTLILKSDAKRFVNVELHILYVKFYTYEVDSYGNICVCKAHIKEFTFIINPNPGGAGGIACKLEHVREKDVITQVYAHGLCLEKDLAVAYDDYERALENEKRAKSHQKSR